MCVNIVYRPGVAIIASFFGSRQFYTRASVRMCLLFCNFPRKKIELLRSFELWTDNLSDCTWKYTKWKREWWTHDPNGVSVYGSVNQFPARKCSRPSHIMFGSMPITCSCSYYHHPSCSSSSGDNSTFDHEFRTIVNSTSFNWINNIVWPLAKSFICSHERTTQTKILWKSQFVFGQQLFCVCLRNS